MINKLPASFAFAYNQIMKTINLLPVHLTFFIALMSFAAPAQETAIWIKGGAHLRLETLSPQLRSKVHDDAGLMWQSDAPWQTVASHTSIVLFPPANIEWSKDDDLKVAFSDLRRRHIGMALGTGILPRTPACQQRTSLRIPLPGVYPKA